jgi:thiamine-monophosphate kinase
MASERELHHFLRGSMFGGAFLGDDTVTLPLSRRSVLTVDQQVEGVHFPSGLDAATVAARLVEVTLSDLAASGAIPKAAMLALSAAEDFDFLGFFRSLDRVLRQHRLPLVGGDLARGSGFRGALFLVGKRPKGWNTLARNRARPGDQLWLVGCLGASALGRHLLERGALWNGRSATFPEELQLDPAHQRSAGRMVQAHLKPKALLEAGWKLARSRKRIAALDISDGLALDLTRLVEESRVGAILDAARVARAFPRSAVPLAQHLGLSPFELALSGGEDYALLFTTPSGVPPPLRSAHPLGQVVETPGLWLKFPAGRLEPLEPTGWDHFQRTKPKETL